MKKLPIGIQSFEEMRQENYYYVDKTFFVKKLVDNGKYYFLSRPRRFGKSLFLDTLKQAFLGKEELFKGLYLEDKWDWQKRYPVIHMSFGGGVAQNINELKNIINFWLKLNQRKLGIRCEEEEEGNVLFELIIKANEKYGQKVVVLVDEYDKPILDNIEKKELATEMRERLKKIYSMLKDADPYLKFVFITGVSKFSKVSLFSGLNQLQDITINPEYAAICGYTQKELEETFSDILTNQEIERVNEWYNGYSWLGERVYNPFDILLYLSEREFRPYWFETGTPSFLIKLLIEEKFYIANLEELRVGEQLIGSFDVDAIYPENLLFQTGYLTIAKREYENGIPVYQLRFPNKEVRLSLNEYLLDYLVKDYRKKEYIKSDIRKVIKENNFDKLRGVFQSFFASIPYEWYRKNELSGYEGYYASVVYAYFTASGFDVVVEDATSLGKIDMTLLYEDRAYIFEFKVIELEGEGKAIEQIKKREYYKKYKNKKKIYLIGVEFSKDKRNIVSFDTEEIK